MPTFTIDQLRGIATKVLTAAGVPAADAAVVAQELADANAVGHDSHGVMRLMQYVDGIQKGFFKLGTPIEIVDRKSTRLNSSHT